MNKTARRMEVHLVANAHLDPVWLWRRAEGLGEALATFRGALERMREYPGLTFTASSAALFEWIERVDPLLFAAIRRAVKSGAWCVAGGWQTESDCNLPSGESFARNALYSQRWLRGKFGRASLVGFCPDSFGHCGSMPQLLKHGGMRGYVFMRPSQSENPSVPPGSFVWEGTDGTRIPAFHIVRSYESETPEALNRNLDALERLKSGPAMCFFGCGDHGGEPTRRLLDAVAEARRSRGNMRIRFSTPDAFFRRLARAHAPQRVLRGEMGPHSVGCYTAHSGVKRANRKTEEALLAAERLSALAGMAAGAPAQTRPVREAWKMLLFNQFHDVLAGTCAREAYEEVLDHMAAAGHAAKTIETESVQRVGSAVDTRGEGCALLAFNHQTAPWSGVIETDDISGPGRSSAEKARLTDHRGRLVPFQRVATSCSARRYRIVFEADLPALGYRLFRVVERKETARCPAPRGARLRADAGGMENGRVRLAVRPDGTVRLRNTATGRDLLAAGAGRPVAVQDPSDTWGHGIVRYDGNADSFDCAGRGLLESGPLRARLRVRWRLGASRVTLDYILTRLDSVVEVRGRIDWHKRGAVLKIVFPFQARAKQYEAEIPYGVIRRATSGQESPMQRWLDISSGGTGLAIANDCKYGLDVRGNRVAITLARSPAYAHHRPSAAPGPEGWFLDQGESEFRLALIPHERGARPEIDRAARFLNAGPVLSWEGIHPGRLPDCGGFMRVRGSVAVETVKRAEEGSGLVVRAVEVGGRRCVARFELPSLNRSWTSDFRPGMVKTFIVPDSGRRAVRETNFLED